MGDHTNRLFFLLQHTMVTPEDKRILFAEPQASSENVSSPTLPIEFGDAIPFVKHVIKLGALYTLR